MSIGFIWIPGKNQPTVVPGIVAGFFEPQVREQVLETQYWGGLTPGFNQKLS